MAEAKLTERQQRFVEAYNVSGNGTDAARTAGYAHAEVAAVRLLRNVRVAAALKVLTSKRRRAVILTLNERHELLSKIAKNAKAKHADRIRACEVLMRANGEFASVAIVTPPGGAGAAVVSPDGEGGPVVMVYVPANGRDAGR